MGSLAEHHALALGKSRNAPKLRGRLPSEVDLTDAVPAVPAGMWVTFWDDTWADRASFTDIVAHASEEAARAQAGDSFSVAFFPFGKSLEAVLTGK